MRLYLSLCNGSFTKIVAKSVVPLMIASLMLVACDEADTTPDINVETDTGTVMVIECDDGLELCDDYCVDLDASALHCGACDTPCKEGEICEDGSCVLWCPEGQTACGDQCTDLTSSQANCGKCGKVCEAGYICEEGECIISCPTPQVVCNNQCANLETDNAYCGSCNISCTDGMVCSEGQCALSCGPGLKECSGSCVDIQNDRRYCGSCTNRCEDGHVCEEGECILTCPVNMTDCDGTCINLNTDNNNCGECGEGCEPGSLCRNGSCSYPVTGLALDQVKLSVAVNDQVPLTAIITPENADNTNVAWTSANNNITTVSSDGLVTGMSKGETIITAITADGGYQATCLVNVYIAVEEVVVTPTTINLAPGADQALDVAISPVNASNTKVIWTTEDLDVAMVDHEGVVRAIGDGTTTITATSVEGGHTGTCEVNVNSIRVNTISITPNSLTLNISDSIIHQQLVPNVTPHNANNKTVLWHSSNLDVVTVSNTGLVTATGAGETIVTAISADGGKTATCAITVLP